MTSLNPSTLHDFNTGEPEEYLAPNNCGNRDSLAFIISMFTNINNDIAEQELADDYGDFTCVVPFAGDDDTVEFYMHQMENLEFTQVAQDQFANYLRTTYGQANKKPAQ